VVLVAQVGEKLQPGHRLGVVEGQPGRLERIVDEGSPEGVDLGGEPTDEGEVPHESPALGRLTAPLDQLLTGIEKVRPGPGGIVHVRGRQRHSGLFERVDIVEEDVAVELDRDTVLLSLILAVLQGDSVEVVETERTVRLDVGIQGIDPLTGRGWREEIVVDSRGVGRIAGGDLGEDFLVVVTGGGTSRVTFKFGYFCWNMVTVWTSTGGIVAPVALGASLSVTTAPELLAVVATGAAAVVGALADEGTGEGAAAGVVLWQAVWRPTNVATVRPPTRNERRETRPDSSMGYSPYVQCAR
jgi:hypothetical protein